MLTIILLGGLKSRIQAFRHLQRSRTELSRAPPSLRRELNYVSSRERAAAIFTLASDHGWQRESREMYES